MSLLFPIEVIKILASKLLTQNKKKSEAIAEINKLDHDFVTLKL